MECVCPILGRPTRVRELPGAPPPWQLVQCTETGFVFLRNPPAYSDVADEFAWEKTFASHREQRHIDEPLISRISDVSKNIREAVFANRDKLYAISRKLVGHMTSVSILDIGSGRGHRLSHLCRNLKDQGIDAIPCGLEISPALTEMSDEEFAVFGGRVINDAAMDGLAKMDPGSFDIVIMSCYLEHEREPLEILRRARRVLRPNGFVIIKVPNYDCWSRRWLRGHRWCGFRYPDHVNYFTPNTLSIVAEQAGFEMQQSRRDRLPTSDNMYAVLHARNPSARPASITNRRRAA